jgi:poly(A) polymerase
MRIGIVRDMRESKVKRLLREPGYPELLDLHRADCLGSHRDLDIYAWLRDYEANLQPEQKSPPPLITGETLKEMGYTPGPKFREILTDIEDAQLEGRLTDAHGAREYVREHWPRET